MVLLEDDDDVLKRTFGDTTLGLGRDDTTGFGGGFGFDGLTGLRFAEPG
jgi:hypothetical protein